MKYEYQNLNDHLAHIERMLNATNERLDTLAQTPVPTQAKAIEQPLRKFERTSSVTFPQHLLTHVNSAYAYWVSSAFEALEDTSRSAFIRAAIVKFVAELEAERKKGRS